MRRGLLKDLANTPTQIVCGWKLYGPDTVRLRAMSGERVSINLLTGECESRGAMIEPPLGIAHDLMSWLKERYDRDGIPDGLVLSASVTLEPRSGDSGSLAVGCTTLIETTRGAYESQALAHWHHQDIDGR